MPETSIREQLHKIALTAPKTSGVYFWKDKTGTVIYVGKAKSLKNRLSSYFTPNKDIKTRILVSNAAALEYIQTETEYEALLLENTLIKKYSPKYNINLKDGKTYPVLKLTNELFPRLYRTRNIKNDGAKYFGPFPNVGAIDIFLDLIKRNYKLRQCKRLKKRKTPCLYFHIGRCRAPCCGKITSEEYNKEIQEICFLLEGDVEAAVRTLTEQMKEAAKRREFEKAARLRDGIQAVYSIRGQNIVQDMDPESRDYIAWAFEGAMVTFTVLRMRNGRLVGRDLYRANSLKDEKEILPEFLSAYYTDKRYVPPRIFIPYSSAGNELAEFWLKTELGANTHITGICIENDSSGNENADYSAQTEAASPTVSYTKDSGGNGSDYAGLPKTDISHHRAALKMAQFNAKEDAARRLREQGDFAAVEDLQKRLNLPYPPHRIEGYDIAHLHGSFPAAALISFKDGNPDKKNYRIFRLKTTDGIIDDYASMKEVIARRYTRLVNEKAELPDLILIDGGIGQVNAAYGIISALQLTIPIVGLAEKNEEIYFPHNSVPQVLPRRSDALRLLQRIRDEAHRFSNTHNNKLRDAAALYLQFEALPHIGKKRAALLLKRFGSLQNLAAAVPEAISAVAKVSVEQAQEIAEKVKADISSEKANDV